MCFIYPSYRIYKKTGINPITFKNNDSAHDLIGVYMKIEMFLIFVSALESSNKIGLKFVNYIDNELLKNTGFILMIISLLGVVLAQFQMGSSWRIGIDEKNKTDLKISGLFKKSRNPIFLAMIISQFGFFLFHSTTLNLFILLISYCLISIQIRLEESHLESLHGQTYLEYKKIVPRWF